MEAIPDQPARNGSQASMAIEVADEGEEYVIWDGGDSPATVKTESDLGGDSEATLATEQPEEGEDGARSRRAPRKTVKSEAKAAKPAERKYNASFLEECEAGGRIGIEIRRRNEEKYKDDCRTGGINSIEAKRNLRHASLKTYLLSAEEVGLQDVARPVVCPREGCGHTIMLKFVDLGWALEVNLREDESGDGADTEYVPDIRLVIQTCNATHAGKKCNGRYGVPDWWDGATIDYSTLDLRLKRNGLVEKSEKKAPDEAKPGRKARKQSAGSQSTGSQSGAALLNLALLTLAGSSGTPSDFPASPASAATGSEFLDEFLSFSDGTGLSDLGLDGVSFEPSLGGDLMDVSNLAVEHFGGATPPPSQPHTPPPAFPIHFGLPPLAPGAINIPVPPPPPPPRQPDSSTARVRRKNSLPQPVFNSAQQPNGYALSRTPSTGSRRRVGSPSRPGPYPFMGASPAAAAFLQALTVDSLPPVSTPQNPVFELVLSELVAHPPPLRHSVPRVIPAHRGPAQYGMVMHEMLTRPPVLRTPGRMRGAQTSQGRYTTFSPSPLGPALGTSGVSQHQRSQSVSSSRSGASVSHRRSPSQLSSYDPLDPFTHLNLGSPSPATGEAIVGYDPTAMDLYLVGDPVGPGQELPSQAAGSSSADRPAPHQTAQIQEQVDHEMDLGDLLAQVVRENGLEERGWEPQSDLYSI